MICRIFQLRERGNRIERARILAAGGVVGDLRVFIRYTYPQHLVCQLLGSDGESFVLPVLSNARLRAVGPRGLLLAGTEIIPGRHSKSRDKAHYPQAWYCVPGDAVVAFKPAPTHLDPSRFEVA